MIQFGWDNQDGTPAWAVDAGCGMVVHLGPEHIDLPLHGHKDALSNYLMLLSVTLGPKEKKA